MDRPLTRLLLVSFVVLAMAVGGARATAVVSGFAICDQCRDGQLTLFDYPLAGIKVTMSCTDNDGKVTMSQDINTNIFGGFIITFDGTPDLTKCQFQVPAGQQHQCTVAPGAARKPEITTDFLGLATYFVDSLFSSPGDRPYFCGDSSPSPTNPGPAPKPRPNSPPPAKLPPAQPVPEHPTLPFLQPSACPHTIWMKPEYQCHWSLVNPDSKVAVVFGIVPAVKFGIEMTLSQALQSSGGDPYKTLLREATAALLNSYSSINFPYKPGRITIALNIALLGSGEAALRTAHKFMDANSGYGKVKCKFSACK